MKSIAILSAILLSLCAVPRTLAQPTTSPPDSLAPRETAAIYTVETVLEGLDRPYGLALRSVWSKDLAAELYLVERGAGRVLKMVTDRPGISQEVIVGFPTGDAENGSTEKGDVEGPTIDGPSEDRHLNRALPLGLLFLTHSKLVVGSFMRDEPKGDGSQILVVYRLPGEDSVLRADEIDHQTGTALMVSHVTADRPLAGEGPFCGLAKTSDAVYFAPGNVSQGSILKASLEANRLNDLQSFIARKQSSDQARPAGMTVHPQPKFPYLVVGQMGRLDVPRDSKLAFYSPKSGRLAMEITTGLHDLVDLTYSPSGNLYGIDLAWQMESDGGVFRLDDALLAAKPACRAVKIVSVQRPTSLVFAPDGALYVTALGPASGTAETPSGQKTGVLLKITGEW